MTVLRSLQESFADAVRSGARAFEDEVSAQGRVPATVRVDIYRNAYRMRLRECIETDHEILGLYLGDALFDEMVATYVPTHPSRATSLRHFCDRLPAYLATTPPFSESPQVASLAGFERLLMDAFDAADAPRVTRDAVLKTPPSHWPELRVDFHPSVRLFLDRDGAVPIWQALRSGQSPTPPTGGTTTGWLLWRNAARLTQFRSLSPVELQAFALLKSGKTFADLCEALLASMDEAEVSQAALAILWTLLDAGTVSHIGGARTSANSGYQRTAVLTAVEPHLADPSTPLRRRRCSTCPRHASALLLGETTKPRPS